MKRTGLKPRQFHPLPLPGPVKATGCLIPGAQRQGGSLAFPDSESRWFHREIIPVHRRPQGQTHRDQKRNYGLKNYTDSASERPLAPHTTRHRLPHAPTRHPAAPRRARPARSSARGRSRSQSRLPGGRSTPPSRRRARAAAGKAPGQRRGRPRRPGPLRGGRRPRAQAESGRALPAPLTSSIGSDSASDSGSEPDPDSGSDSDPDPDPEPLSPAGGCGWARRLAGVAMVPLRAGAGRPEGRGGGRSRRRRPGEGARLPARLPGERRG